jgi:hypothetical protein
MRKFAEDTTVPIQRSRAEIDKLLRDWGVEGIAWQDDFANDHVQLRFVWANGGEKYLARVGIKLPGRKSLEDDALDGRTLRVNENKMRKLLDARGKREHRLLALWLKATLNAVDAGLIKAEELFLPFLEGKDGYTVAEMTIEKLPMLLSGSAERLLLPGRTT